MKKDELLKNIEKYWTNRAEGYSQVNLEELAGEKWPVWLSVIEEHMPKVERKDVLKRKAAAWKRPPFPGSSVPSGSIILNLNFTYLLN